MTYSIVTPHFQVIRLPTEGRHSEVAEKEVKPVPSKDLAPLDVQSFRRPFEGKHSEVAEKEAKPVPSKDLTPPDVQAFFLSCEGSHLEAIKQAVMMELGVRPESLPGKEAKPVPSKDPAPPDFQSIRHPTEGCYSEDSKNVLSKNLALISTPIDFQTIRHPSEAKLQTYTSPPSNGSNFANPMMANDESNIAKKLQTWPTIKSEDIPDFIPIDVGDQIESSEAQKAPNGTENNESEVNNCMKNIEREEPEGMANEAYVNEV